MKRHLLIAFLFLAVLRPLSAQGTFYGPGYQTLMQSNPAFAGAEGAGNLRISYLNFYPGRNYNLHSFYASYDDFFEVLHGGAAVFVSDDYLGGVINDMKGGLSYSYHLQAGRDLFINGGLSAAFIHRGLNFSGMVFPDQIDPVSGATGVTSETLNIKGRTLLDVGAGVLITARNYIAALAVNHLASPDMSLVAGTEERTGREFQVHLSAKYEVGKGKKLALRPMLFGDIQKNRMVLGAGSSMESGAISLSAMILTNRAGDIDLQAGFFLKGGIFSFFYNYCFNISSGNNLLPASLVHNAGLVFSLNNVDKRKTVKTINFPKC
jgi:type IX secretion system PorP/SprF family membrane protein